MNALRWSLGLSTAITAGGVILLACFADGFRRSLGASSNAAWKIILPLLVMAALLGTLAFPAQRLLLHGTAIVMVAVMLAFCYIVRESAFVGAVGLLYCGLWFTYYSQTAGDSVLR